MMTSCEFAGVMTTFELTQATSWTDHAASLSECTPVSGQYNRTSSQASAASALRAMAGGNRRCVYAKKRTCHQRTTAHSGPG